ncbi:MAG: ROK family protein [Hyphomicrobiaceae bacterium]|nr:ROK family protein [Hyphomicrobiaceae bacterium]
MEKADRTAAYRPRVGIDLGGTKIAGIVIGDDGKTIAEARCNTPKGDYQQTISAISALATELTAQSYRGASVGIGIPGSISPATGRVQNANSTWLNGRPFKEDIEAALERSVRIANDANCFALSEAADGAAAGCKSMFGVILGTGCGGGLVIDGRIVDGPRGIGGEWGHNPLPWPDADEYPGPLCWCGRHGCLEMWVSGPGLTDDHRRSFSEELPAEVIASKAHDGHPEAAQTLARHASRLARGLAGIINVFDPERIVIGGGLSNMAHLYEDLPDLIAPHIFSDNKRVLVVPPAHGPESGARGAAWLWEPISGQDSAADT